MGFWDFVKSLVGIGGCTMKLDLHATDVYIGGTLAGKARLIGADKPWPVTSVKVQVQYILVKSKEGSAIPEMDVKILVDEVIAKDDTIGAGETKEFPFSVTLPTDLATSGDGVSYQVLVTADIPGLKDPTAKSEVNMLEGGERPTAEAILAKIPQLSAEDERSLVDGLIALSGAHLQRIPADDHIAIEPFLVGLFAHESLQVRAYAIDTWAGIIGDRGSKAHVERLDAPLADLQPHKKYPYMLLSALARFGKFGGLERLKPLVEHEDPAIRVCVAQAIEFQGGGQGAMIALAQTLLADDDVTVQAAAVEALASFGENLVVMKQLAALATPETPDAVRKVLPDALARSWKFRAEMWPALKTLAADPSPVVRAEAAWRVSRYDQQPGFVEVVTALLGDSEIEVQRRISSGLYNTRDEGLKNLRGLLNEHLAATDDDDVRKYLQRALEKELDS